MLLKLPIKYTTLFLNINYKKSYMTTASVKIDFWQSVGALHDKLLMEPLAEESALYFCQIVCSQRIRNIKVDSITASEFTKMVMKSSNQTRQVTGKVSR